MKKLFFIAIAVSLFQCKPADSTKTTASLENTYWKLAEMNGVPVITPSADVKDVHLVLTTEGSEKRIKGFAGCNGLGGNYTVEDNKINFEVITTKMFCEDRMNIENFLTKALDEADNYKIKGETLELYQGNAFLVKFESVNQKGSQK